EARMPLVWHDPLCPMTPPSFLASCVRRALADGLPVAGVLHVTDTVKEVHVGDDGPVVGQTLDRDRLRRLVSPLGLTPELMGDLDGWPPTDFRSALAVLRERGPVAMVEAPSEARRVGSVADLRLLEAVTRS